MKTCRRSSAHTCTLARHLDRSWSVALPAMVGMLKEDLVRSPMLRWVMPVGALFLGMGIVAVGPFT